MGYLGLGRYQERKNVELYDVSPRFAIAELLYACLNFIVLGGSGGTFVSGELKCREGYSFAKDCM